MLCNYLNDIYLNQIHPSLSRDEFIYSTEVKETFLDIWYSRNVTISDHSNNLYYYKDDKELFYLWMQPRRKKYLYCHYHNVLSIFSVKYNIKHDDIMKIIELIVKNVINIEIISRSILSFKFL